MANRYIGTGGNITRRSGVRIRDFSSKRLSIVLVLTTLLFLSNPANQNFISSAPSLTSRRIGSYTIEIFGMEINVAPKSKSYSSDSTSPSTTAHNSKYIRGTNYQLFSLSKSMNGVDIGILFNSVPLCTRDGRAPSFCQWVSNNMCHQQRIFNHRNKAFTVLRIMQGLKIASFLLQKCYIFDGPLFPKINMKYMLNNPLTLIFSVFHETNSIKDIISMNVFLYPALALLERITTIRAAIESDFAFHFYGISVTILLIILIGGISNIFAAYLLNDKVGGMKGSIAASLGFIAVVKPQDIVIDLFDVKLTAGEALFSTFAVTFTSSLLGFHSIAAGEWEMGNIISWACGGLVGYAVGEYQSDRLHPWLIRLFS
jgi:hypothetical protein